MAKINALCCALLSCSTLIQIDVFFLLLDRNKHEVEMEMEIEVLVQTLMAPVD